MDTFQHTFLDTFERFITGNSLVKPGQSVLLAVSGGIDSMVMLDIFLQLQQVWNFSLAVAHVNHQLRGADSDSDEEFVASATRSHGLQFLSERVDVHAFQSEHRLSKQEAARSLRYAFFEKARLETRSDAVATAHHADDNAETVLMNALRGAGVRGLSGIPVRREPGRIIRPLLFAYRSEIEEYAAARNIGHREDASNASHAYTRNSVRHSLIPFLNDELQTDASRSLNRLSALMRSLGEKLREEISNVSGQIVSVRNGTTVLGIKALLDQPLILQEEILLGVLRDVSIEPTAQKVQACLELCNQSTGRSLDLSADWRILHDRGELLLHRRTTPEPFVREVTVGQEYDFGAFRFAIRPLDHVPQDFRHEDGAEIVDAERIGHLVLRTWRDGDWFVPIGMRGRKKVSDYFINEKMPTIEKHATPILESDGDIVWVCGHRLDQRFSVSGSTKKALELRFERYQSMPPL